MNIEKNKAKHILKKNAICYYLAIARGQKAVKRLQQQIVMHPYFNPILLFKKVSQGHSILTKNSYIEYIQKYCPDLPASTISVYMKKHNLNTIIQCQQFISTILPYTPDVLRNLTATIIWQVRSSPSLNKDVQILFRNIIRTEILQIVNISTFRRQLFIKWKQIRCMFQKNIKQQGTALSKRSIQEQFTMFKLRDWLQLWIDINEMDILDMVRWMGGPKQEDIKRNYCQIYDKNVTIFKTQKKILKIKQRPSKDKIEMLRSMSLKPLNRRENQMLQKKIYYIKKKQQSKYSQKSFSSKKGARSQNESVTRTNSRYIRQQQKNYPLQFFYQYLFFLLSGQKYLQQKREMLQPFILQVIQILREALMSKKNSMTKISKIVSFIERYSELNQNEKNCLNDVLGELSIENETIISIFTTYHGEKSQQINFIDQYLVEQSNQKLRQANLKRQISQTLRNYCNTKCRLIQISQKIIKQKYQVEIFKNLLQGLEKTIKKQNLIKILDRLKIQYSNENIQIVLKHFGDGNQINQSSFYRVFNIQGK